MSDEPKKVEYTQKELDAKLEQMKLEELQRKERNEESMGARVAQISDMQEIVVRLLNRSTSILADFKVEVDRKFKELEKAEDNHKKYHEFNEVGWNKFKNLIEWVSGHKILSIIITALLVLLLPEISEMFIELAKALLLKYTGWQPGRTPLVK